MLSRLAVARARSSVEWSVSHMRSSIHIVSDCSYPNKAQTLCNGGYVMHVSEALRSIANGGNKLRALLLRFARRSGNEDLAIFPQRAFEVLPRACFINCSWIAGVTGLTKMIAFTICLNSGSDRSCHDNCAARIILQDRGSVSAFW